MTDSDQESIPSDSVLTNALQQAVGRVFDSGQLDNLTVKRVRATVESTLHLPTDYFKNRSIWKDRSKDVILEEVDRQHSLKEQDPQPPSDASPQQIGRSKSMKKEEPEATKSKVRQQPGPSSEISAKTKKRKREPSVQAPTDSSSLSSHVSELNTSASEEDDNVSPASKRKRKQQKVLTVKSAEINGVSRSGDTTVKADTKTKPKDDEKVLSSDSEMSVVLDEAPAPKKPARKSQSRAKSKPSSKAKPSKAKSEADIDPQEAEIKRLQTWLLKCGIRRLWHKELASYPTSRAKIAHLKQMLKDAGMDGRFSVEKAREIKEERELQAEVMAVQDSAKRWGQEDDEESGDGRKPRRRLARGLKDLDILGDEDGEETD
ncbi:MAG: hypothetical protein M1833_002323 [Piccolia ochrophora]|nr:MAG: hypothetical protein M1833_002323 [Piccolia ochrophora]